MINVIWNSDSVTAMATVNAREAVRIERSVTINRPRSELYGVWRDFTSLPRYIADLESVTDLGNGRSRWVAALPGGKHVEWTAEIVTQRENEIVSWKTVDDSDIAHAGSVIFRDAPAGRSERSLVGMEYECFSVDADLTVTTPRAECAARSCATADCGRAAAC